MRGSSAKRSALHGAGDPDCELDPRSLEDPHWRLRAILPWSPPVRFRANMLLADVLDGYTRFSGQRCSLLAHKLPQRFREPRVVENPHMVGTEELRHPSRVAHTVGFREGGKV